ncbi:hypothetical protein ABZ471_06810 [Streptomyces sp. NPDC005728]|uniref:hypothetical protein n=1 Tax=Streptomyces sp. NPDC005728 TaxID=3157054 RepID=UPI0033EE9B1A
MTRISTFQRVALLAASTTVITGGVLLPGTAFAATAPQTVAAASVADVDAAAQWTATTDDSSGITVQLPGNAQVEEYEAGGAQARVYTVETAYGSIGFAIYEMPGANPSDPWDLPSSLQAAVDNLNADPQSASTAFTSSDVEKGTTSDGFSGLQANLTATDGTVGHIRLVDLGPYMIQFMSTGTADQQDVMDQDYEQLLSNVQLPDSGAAQPDAPAQSV